MTRPRLRTSARLASRMLRGFLDPREAESVAEDLRELASARGRWRGLGYFWFAFAGYPLRMALERMAEATRGGLGTHGRGGDGMEGLRKDMAWAARSLRRSPGFAVLTTLILALSLGAATAIASVVRGVLIEPLPYAEPDRLQALWLVASDGERGRMTPGNLSDLRAMDGVFESVAGYQGRTAALATDAGAVFLRGGGVTPDYFRTLGVGPLVGRTFRDDEGHRDGEPVVILGQALWQRAFGADPSVVGTTIDLGGASLRVVGVVPSGVYPTTITVGTEIPFHADGQDFFVPLRFSDDLWDMRRPHILGAVGRLRDGIDPETATAALETETARLHAAGWNEGEVLAMNPFAEEVVGDVRFALLTLLGTVGLVLLIAAVNVGSLFVLRGDDRRGEIDIRLALGAPWGRIARQLVGESLLIAAMAAAGAWLLAAQGIDLMRRLVPYQVPRLADVGVEGPVLAAMAVFGALLAVAFGSMPAWRLRRALSHGGRRGATAGRARRALQGSVVAFQAGLAVIVLVGAMLLGRSYSALRAVDVGFDGLDAWVVPVSGAGDLLPEVLEGVRSLPGVRAAALTYDHPLERNWGDAFLIPGRLQGPDEPNPSGTLRPFGDGYFEAAGLRVVEGRVPDAVDLSGSSRWAVVNETLRDRYFPEGGAVGAVIDVPSARRNFGDSVGTYTITGVVEDVRFLGPEHPSEPAFYLPLSHFPVGASTLLIRPERAGVDVVPAVRQVVRDVAPGAAVQSVQRLEHILLDLTARRRFNAVLLVSFAGMALVLCGLGAYGLVGRAVVSRLREIGIRMALGAGSGELARAVVASALRPLLFGGVAGLIVAALLARSIRSLLFGIEPADPLSFAASSTFLLVVGGVAAVVPTIRALSVDPARTLREE